MRSVKRYGTMTSSPSSLVSRLPLIVQLTLSTASQQTWMGHRGAVRWTNPLPQTQLMQMLADLDFHYVQDRLSALSQAFQTAKVPGRGGLADYYWHTLGTARHSQRTCLDVLWSTRRWWKASLRSTPSSPSATSPWSSRNHSRIRPVGQLQASIIIIMNEHVRRSERPTVHGVMYDGPMRPRLDEAFKAHQPTTLTSPDGMSDSDDNRIMSVLILTGLDY